MMLRGVTVIFVCVCVCVFSYLGRVCATVVATRCVDGIVIASDALNRANSALISSRDSRKVFMLTESTVLCSAASSGSATMHFQQLYSELRDITEDHNHQYGTPLSTYSIAKVARQLVTSKYCDAHVVVAGYESWELATNQPTVRYVLSEVLPGGTLLHQDSVSAGSGGSLIAGLLEEQLRGSTQEISHKLHPTPDTSINSSHFASDLKENCGGTRSSALDTEHTSSYAGSPKCMAEPALSKLTVVEAAAHIRQCLRVAGRLDPQTGADKYAMWILSHKLPQ